MTNRRPKKRSTTAWVTWASLHTEVPDHVLYLSWRSAEREKAQGGWESMLSGGAEG
jgi:hypothetical protein